MLERMKGLLRDEEGQGMAEYGLILALVCSSCYGSIYATRYWNISNKFNEVDRLRLEANKYIISLVKNQRLCNYCKAFDIGGIMLIDVIFLIVLVICFITDVREQKIYNKVVLPSYLL